MIAFLTAILSLARLTIARFGWRLVLDYVFWRPIAAL